MSCKHNNKGPLHIKNFREIKQQATPCNNDMCDLVYNFSNCPCVITNKSTYLDINCCKNNNTLTYNGSDLRVEKVKLYLPSLNYYNDSQHEGELVIYCSGGMQKPSVTLCIPIKTTTSNNINSTKWFSKFSNHVPNTNQSHQVNVQNYTLNDVIPQCGFAIFNGSMHESPCHTDGAVLLFDPEYAIMINVGDYNKIKKKLSSPSIMLRYNVKTNNDYKKLIWNGQGTSGGPGSIGKKKSKWKLTCNPIVDQNDKYLADGPRSSFVVPNIPELSEKTKTILIILGVVIGVLLLGWYVIIPYAKPAWDNVSKRFKKKKDTPPGVTTGGGRRRRRQ